MAGENRATIIDSVRTPLGFFALVVLAVEAVLAGLAVRAEGTDFTILIVGLVGTLILVVSALLLAVRKDPSLLKPSVSRQDGTAVALKYDAFVAAPMAAFADAKAYQRSRNDVLRLVKVLQRDVGARDVFYAGEHLSSSRAFEAADLSLESDVAALRSSACLILVYPRAIPTSALVEVGMAIALRKPVIIHVLDGVDLPFLLQHEQGATSQHGSLHIYKYANFSEILQFYKSNPRILARVGAAVRESDP